MSSVYRDTYREVINSRVTDRVRYLSAHEEEQYYIAQANVPIDEDGRLKGDLVTAQKGGSFYLVSPDQINFMDVSPKQLVSVSASLIPFLEHDDANRALMGSNMQRQSVPLIKPDAPLVGTGLERKVAIDSGAVLTAMHSGVVEYEDAEKS